MDIRNIDDLKNEYPAEPTPGPTAEEPTVPPNAENTQAGVPTPIDNVAQEEQAEVEAQENDSDE